MKITGKRVIGDGTVEQPFEIDVPQATHVTYMPESRTVRAGDPESKQIFAAVSDVAYFVVTE